MTPEEARSSPLRNMLDECVGCPDCQPLTGILDLRSNDCLFLSTDGVHSSLEPEMLAALLNREDHLKTILDEVIRECLAAGGEDNLTIIGIEI